jgi:hypothetical protein
VSPAAAPLAVVYLAVTSRAYRARRSFVWRRACSEFLADACPLSCDNARLGLLAERKEAGRLK